MKVLMGLIILGICRSSKTLTTRINFSTGFRPPHISELLADGVTIQQCNIWSVLKFDSEKQIKLTSI